MVILAAFLPPIVAADALLATAAGSGATYEEAYDSPDWWQTTSYQIQTSLRLEGYYIGQEGPNEVYQLTRKQGMVRFWGTTEERYYGSTFQWPFDVQHNFDINTSEGLLRFRPADQRVVYVGFGISTTSSGDIQPYRLRIYASNSPPTIRLYAYTPNEWWFGPEFDVSGPPDTLTPVAPQIEVTDAKMVTPGELGIGIRVRYPASVDASVPRLVLIDTVVNGTPIQKQFDLSSYTTPGQDWGRVPGQQNAMYDSRGHLLPTTPLRIALSQFGVDRFTNSLAFNVPGLAYCGAGLSSTTSQAHAQIRLPVIVLHGYIHPYGYPLPWWQAGPFFPYEGAYKSLKEFMQTVGYDKENNWELYPYQMYRTYWDPSDFSYTDPQNATPAAIEEDLSGLLTRIWPHNYARKVDLVCHSFGGLVGRHFAAAQPTQVNKVLTVGTPHRGATFFYEVAFTKQTKTEADADLVISAGPLAGQPNILRWTAPSYDALVLESSGLPIPLIYPNPLTTAKGPGVRYSSLYSEADPQTHYQLTLHPTAVDWYQPVHTNQTNGDGYILALSASEFGDKSYRLTAEHHATLLNEKATQDLIAAILSEEPTGDSFDDRGSSSYSKGTIFPGATIKRSVPVGADIQKAEFALDWPGSTLELVLRDPLGRVIGPTWTNGVDGVLIDIRTNSCRYTVTKPAAGTWTYEVYAANVPPAGEDYLALVHLLKAQAFAEVLAISHNSSGETGLLWPATGRSTLETASSLGAGAAWTVVTNKPDASMGFNGLLVPTTQSRGFYRLSTTIK